MLSLALKRYKQNSQISLVFKLYWFYHYCLYFKAYLIFKQQLEVAVFLLLFMHQVLGILHLSCFLVPLCCSLKDSLLFWNASSILVAWIFYPQVITKWTTYCLKHYFLAFLLLWVGSTRLMSRLIQSRSWTQNTCHVSLWAVQQYMTWWRI